jgi:hypothetical protein
MPHASYLTHAYRDRTFAPKPIYAFWAEKGMLAPGFKGRKVRTEPCQEAL